MLDFLPGHWGQSHLSHLWGLGAGLISHYRKSPLGTLYIHTQVYFNPPLGLWEKKYKILLIYFKAPLDRLLLMLWNAAGQSNMLLLQIICS